MAARNESDRQQYAGAASLDRWSRVKDRRTETAPARAGVDARFERQVDPDGVLDPEERMIRAEMAKKAHMRRLAIKSAQARRARQQGESAA